MKTISFVIVLGVISGCIPNTEKNCEICILQGNWVSLDTSKNIFIFHQNKMIPGYVGLIQNFEDFKIVENEIIIDSVSYGRDVTRKKYAFEVRYQIDYLTEDTLRLLEYSLNLNQDTSTIILTRLSKEYNNNFDELKIKSSPCHGRCPIFEVKIFSNGEVKFISEKNLNKIGHFEGDLDEDNFSYIGRLIDFVDWENLKAEYWGNSSGNQYFEIEFVKANGETIKSTVTTGELPEIDVLIVHLMRILKQTKFSQISTNEY